MNVKEKRIEIHSRDNRHSVPGLIEVYKKEFGGDWEGIVHQRAEDSYNLKL